MRMVRVERTYTRVVTQLPDTFHPDCPFCLLNRKVVVLRETSEAYAVQVVTNGIPQDGRYLIIPKMHCSGLDGLMELHTGISDWSVHEAELIQWLVEHFGHSRDFNLSWNIGRGAGQRIDHLHMWVIFRDDLLELGMDALLAEVRRQ